MNRNEPARASNLERARQYGLSGGDQVGLEVDWTGTLAVVFESIPPVKRHAVSLPFRTCSSRSATMTAATYSKIPDDKMTMVIWRCPYGKGGNKEKEAVICPVEGRPAHGRRGI